MGKAFLSHSSCQKEFVRSVYELVGRSRCVFDECNFENGKLISDEIEKGMSKSDLFVLFVSNESLNSDWVQKEIVLADDFRNRHKNAFLPILIDPNITPATDHRIPDWMKSYLMNHVKTPNKAKDMIQNALRELEYANNPYYAAKRNMFVGRNSEREDIETALNRYIEPHYSSIIMSGLEGIGRRTFLKHILEERGLISATSEPICIKLGSRSSIDNLIIDLTEIVYERVQDSDIENLDKEDLYLKTRRLKSLVKKISELNMYVFIIDDGCIVRPTTDVCGWFVEALDIPELKDCFNVCLISKFRPSDKFSDIYDDFITMTMGALSDQETNNLFNRYCKVLHLQANPSYRTIISLLNGIPSQVYFAVEMIHRTGIDMAIRNQKLIVDNGARPVMTIINEVKQRSEDSFSLLVLLGMLQTTSFSMVCDIVGDENFVYKELEFFYVAGVFSLVGGSKQYIEVHNSISDYLRRSRISIKKDYTSRLNDIMGNFLERIDSKEIVDVSLLYHSVKSAILSGTQIPQKYYLPSFTLNAVSELYSNQQYDQIVVLIDRMLKRSGQYDENTIRDYHYWLCLSLIRLSSKRFEDVVDYFKEGTDYYFLYGFYYRVLRNLDKAEEYLKIALEYNSNHQRTKRELVNVYIMKGDYESGLKLARDNYSFNSTNPFHIQAYFICLLRDNIDCVEQVRGELDMLLGEMKASLDKRAKSMLAVMNGEYFYYIEKNKTKAIKILKDEARTNNHFAIKALGDIYKREDMTEALKSLTAIGSIVNPL